MLLEGSCHCRAVRFSLQSRTPLPYMHCYCSICRKTAGGGGCAINLGGEAETLTVTGKRQIRVYGRGSRTAARARPSGASAAAAVVHSGSGTRAGRS